MSSTMFSSIQYPVLCFEHRVSKYRVSSIAFVLAASCAGVCGFFVLLSASLASRKINLHTPLHYPFSRLQSGFEVLAQVEDVTMVAQKAINAHFSFLSQPWVRTRSYLHSTPTFSVSITSLPPISLTANIVSSLPILLTSLTPCLYVTRQW